MQLLWWTGHIQEPYKSSQTLRPSPKKSEAEIHKNTTDGNFLVKAELLYIYVIM